MPLAPANLRCWKHSRQNTGRPCVGRNGTVVSFPHAEQFVVVSTRSLADDVPLAAGRDARLALQLLHRLGSFLKFLSAKKSCSPAVHVNSAPQSTHDSILSWNSIGPTSHQLEPAPSPRPPSCVSNVMGNGPLVPGSWVIPTRAGRVDQSSGYSDSRRCFLRVRLRANACLARRRSPGFK
jgi:hypothetical protein